MKPFEQFPINHKKNIRYVLTDIDDTLSIKGRIPSASFIAMEQLQKAGIRVILITGRPAGWCDHMARMWPVDGLVGENGAGKSTTVKILSGILVPDAGTCEVDGRTPWKSRIEHVRHIGVVFGQRTQLWWDLPVIESFDLLRDIYRIPDDQYRKEKDMFVELMQLQPLLDVPVRQLSLGQRMRCDLVAALLHRPQILFLDEPTIGLDALSKLAVRDFVKALNRERKVTIILTTHDLEKMLAHATRLFVLYKGELVLAGKPDHVIDMVSQYNIRKPYGKTRKVKSMTWLTG